MRFFDHAETLRQTVAFLRKNPIFALAQNVCSFLLFALLPSQDSTEVGLDLLRCESLNSLDPVTCSRVLEKNYLLLVSMAPLNPDIRSVVRFLSFVLFAAAEDAAAPLCISGQPFPK